MMDVSIIIVSYNTSALLDDCIVSIKSQTTVAFEIIVIDNNSTDDTLEMLRTKHPDVIRIENSQNNGFARANNQGMEIARGKYLFMLNPDTVILDGAVDELFGYLEENTDVGICGPKNVGADMKLQLNCDHYPSLWNILVDYLRLGVVFPRTRIFNRTMMRYWTYDEVKEVERMTGCSLMIRRSVIESVGMLDDRFFVYFEETDLCLRVKKAGYRIVFFPEAAIIHFGGKSAMQERKEYVANTTALNYYLPSRYYFFRKHYGKASEIVLRVIDIAYGGALWAKNMFKPDQKIRLARLAQAKTLIHYALMR